MPHVASEAPSHAHKPALPNPVRVAPNSDRVSNSPFDSLIDDGTQAPAPQPAQSPPAPADKTAARPKDDKKAATTVSDPDAPKAATTADTDTTAPTEITATTGQVVSDGKAKADGKLPVQAKAGDDTKPVDDGKLADGAAPAASVANPANGAIQTSAPAVALAAPVAPIAPVAPAAPLAPAAPVKDATSALAQTVAAAQPAIVTAATPKAKATDPEIQHADSGNPTGDPKLYAAPAIDPQSDGKSQPVAGDADKLAAAHGRDDAPATTHHASTDAPPPVATDAQAAAPKTFDGLVQQAALPSQPQDASPPPATSAAPAAQPPAVPLAGVAVQIAGMAQAGKNRFEIRLDPPELGRIEVRLDVDRDGNTSARLIADRSDTLDLLRRDATGLERALQDAGLKTADSGLQFSLRDQTMGREQSNTPMPRVAQIVVADNTLPAIDATQRNYSRLAGLRGGIDIRV